MTSASPEASGSWRGDLWTPVPDADPAVAGPAQHDAAVMADAAPQASWSLDDAHDDWGAEAARDDASSGLGLAARGLVVVSLAAVAGATMLNLALTNGQVTFFFDLCFVVICLVTTMAVRRSALFTAGVLPPLVYAAVFAVLAVVAPDTVTSNAGAGRVFLTGLADHAAGLVGGYTVALLAVAARMSATDSRRR